MLAKANKLRDKEDTVMEDKMTLADAEEGQEYTIKGMKTPLPCGAVAPMDVVLCWF